MRAQIQRAAVRGERSGVHQFRAGFCEQAFVGVGKFFVKFARQRQTQNGVAEKFQPLIMRRWLVLLVRDGRMRERKAQQIFVAESVAETRLKCGKFRHGKIIWQTVIIFQLIVFESLSNILRNVIKSFQWPKIHMTI